jgi:uncharacterized membrane protein
LKRALGLVVDALVAGFLALLPIYLTILLLLKAMKSLGSFVRPLTRVAPKWFPAEALGSLLVVLMLCFLVGIALRTQVGKTVRAGIEKSVLGKIPGYTLFRGMARQLAGENQEVSWKPALAEIEEALVPAFIIEQLDDGRFTVFVPSVPTALAGAIYILTPQRVHPLNVPFRQAIRAVTEWGSGSKDLVAAMEKETAPWFRTK